MSNPLIDTANLALYDQLRKAVTGSSLSLSEDGTKLVLKAEDGTVLSEVEAPSSGADVDVSALIPKVGDRGDLAGYEMAPIFSVDLVAEEFPEIIINASSPDVMSVIGGAIIVENGEIAGIFDALFSDVPVLPNGPCSVWTKLVFVGSSEVLLGSRWRWKDAVVPSLSFGLVILHWNGEYGVAYYIDDMAVIEDIIFGESEGAA